MMNSNTWLCNIHSFSFTRLKYRLRRLIKFRKSMEWDIKRLIFGFSYPFFRFPFSCFFGLIVAQSEIFHRILKRALSWIKYI